MPATDTRRLTTTSYTILGLLAIRPWSTYALAKQMRRLHHIWPRAESNVYAEPKRLVEAGLATAEAETVGKRPRTRYSITPEGRRALELWLATPNTPPRFESDALVKVLFGNYGTKDELLINLRSFAEEAAAVQALWTSVADEYARGTHEFPERAHVNSLIVRLISEHADTNRRWAEWAIERVRAWQDVAAPVDPEESLVVFREMLDPDRLQS